MEKPDIKKVNLTITGMHCTSCSRIIEKNLAKEKGVTEAKVNFTAEKAAILFDPNTTTPEKLMEIVKKSGYSAVIYEEKNEEENKQRKRQELKSLRDKFIISLVLSLPMAYFMITDFFEALPGTSTIMPYMGIISLILTTPIQFGIGIGFYKGSWAALRMKTFNMDSLIAIGTSVAFLYSLFNFVSYTIAKNSIIGAGGEKIPELYFETAAFLITFVTLGKLLESKAKSRTSEAIKKLMGLQPKTAHIVTGDKIEDIPIESVKAGDILLVKPGERIPVDGIVTNGHSSVDESMITGESIPVEKISNSKIIGGTINKNGSLEFEATRVGEETILSQIIRLVEDAQNSKAPIQNFADRISAFFVPAIIAAAVLTFLVWFVLLHSTLSFALMAFTSVIVIACPCTLGLATPTALMVGTGKGAEYGILIKGGEPLEMACKINAIVFDKTGTITEGKPKITDIKSIDGADEQKIVQLTYSLEQHSEHPLAEAVTNYAKEKDITPLKISDFSATPGLGIRAKIDGTYYFVGKPGFDENAAKDTQTGKEIQKLEEEGKTVIILSDGTKIIGIIGIADTAKPNAAETIERLKRKGLSVYMMTGDTQRTAEAIGKNAGIDNIIAEVMPKDKSEEIRKLQAQGLKVAMVGDGINDAPALAQAELGIAMGSGTDVAIETGGIVLIKNDLRDVINAIELSEQTIGKIKQNMFFALFYNVIGIPIAARALAGFGLILKPELAGLAMALSSVSVVSNSLLLKNFRPGKKNYISIVAPIMMIILFSFIFIEFARFSSSIR